MEYVLLMLVGLAVVYIVRLLDWVAKRIKKGSPIQRVSPCNTKRSAYQAGRLLFYLYPNHNTSTPKCQEKFP